jgi:hypothetical protein
MEVDKKKKGHHRIDSGDGPSKKPGVVNGRSDHLRTPCPVPMRSIDQESGTHVYTDDMHLGKHRVHSSVNQPMNGTAGEHIDLLKGKVVP